jgi:hypothetical protein
MATSIAKILELGEHENKFHPTATKKYQEFLNDISKDIPLDTIAEKDAKEFLSEWDYHKYEQSKESLSEWLAKCRLTNDSSTLKVYPDSFPIWGTLGFKDLLMKVYQGKEIKKRIQEAEANAQFQAYLDFQRKTREREQARAEHQQWVDRLNKSLDTLKANLHKNTMPEFQTPAWLKSYSPSLWVKQLSRPTEDWFTLNNNIPIAANKLILEKALRNCVDVRYFYQAYYLPSVEYEMVSPPLVSVKGHLLKAKPGVACLKWRLATYVISIAEFELTEGTIIDTRYGYDFEARCSPEKLGRVYSGPEFWQYQPAFITPISLLALLAWGKSEMLGVEVLKRSSPYTTYRIEGFPEEVSLHDDFRRFMVDMTKKTSLDKALLDRKMCDKETAQLVKAKLEKLQESPAPSLVPQKLKESGIETGDDFSDMVTALAGLGYAKVEAMPAAKHVCQKFPDATMEKKMALVLQYLSQ